LSEVIFVEIILHLLSKKLCNSILEQLK